VPMIRWHIHSPPFARAVREYHESNVQGGRTSQLSRTIQRDLAIDLSGPKALGESLTPQSNSTVADVVDLQVDSSSSAAAPGSRVPSGRTASGPQSELSTMSGGTIRDNGRKQLCPRTVGFPTTQAQ